MENIEWLINWYKSNCDGDWEHTYGITIQTVDNPGWMIRADLTETSNEGKQVSKKVETSETDWYVINCDGNTFEGFGDPSKLELLIGFFRELIDTPNS